MIKPTAFVSLAPFGIVGTADNFKMGQYFKLTGTRGNEWIFLIDDVLKQASKHTNKEHLEYAKHIEGDVKSKIGLCVGFPLAVLISNLADEFGDDIVIKLNKSKNEFSK